MCTKQEDLIMTKSFGATSTTDDVLQGINLSGKRVLLTGVSAGLGVETARALAAHGAQVIGAARDGAATSVWAACVADAEAIGGRYCEDCHVAEFASAPGVREGVQPYALDPQHAQALWQKSEELVGERFNLN
jgi:NAD(P)-dependent dehydrogenase (short-subunit alcohol dehydrogenase family)